VGKLRLRKQDGFTVVELMVVLTILGIVLALGYMYFDFGMRTFARGERQSIAQQAIRLAADYISSEIRYADEIIINPANTNANEYYYIEQQSDSVVYFYRDENGTATANRTLLDSSADDIAYSIAFSEQSAVEKIVLDLVVEFTLEAEDGLYSLDTNVFILNLNDSNKYQDLSSQEEAASVIKFRKPLED